MGTRALVVFRDDGDEELCVLYTQFDGYIMGLGRQLADILAPDGKGRTLVNGYSSKDQNNVYNGMSDLTTRIIYCLKKSEGDAPGGYYLNAAGTRNIGEEYIYTIFPVGPEIIILAEGLGNILFEGIVEKFYEFAYTEKDDDE